MGRRGKPSCGAEGRIWAMLASAGAQSSGQDCCLLLNAEEDALHVQVHDFVEGVLRGLVE